VIRSTPFATSRLANVCRRSWNLRPWIFAFWQAVRKLVLMSVYLEPVATFVKTSGECPSLLLRLASSSRSSLLRGMWRLRPLFVFSTVDLPPLNRTRYNGKEPGRKEPSWAGYDLLQNRSSASCVRPS
jgi:hypothetical protein